MALTGDGGDRQTPRARIAAPKRRAARVRGTCGLRVAGRRFGAALQRLALAMALVLLGWAVTPLPGPALADTPLPPPEGEAILTLSGAITRSNGNGEARFDRAMLEALPRHEFTTSTVWTEGVSHYSGVLLRDLLAAVGAQGHSLTAHAIDGYSATMPLDSVADDGPLVAFLRDGAPMSVRQRGPLWIVFPYDDNPAYRNDTTYGRSVWQLTRIEIER